MRLVVFGATGGIGREFVKQALERGHEVTAFVRSPQKLELAHERLRFVVGDAMNREQAAAAIARQDAVVSCLGNPGLGKSTAMNDMTGHLVEGMKEQGVKRIVYVASAGIENELSGIIGKLAGLALRHVLADHRRAVKEIKAAGLDWTIARPLQLTNGPLTGNYRQTSQGVPAGGSRISRADVAHFLVNALENPVSLNSSIGLAY